MDEHTCRDFLEQYFKENFELLSFIKCDTCSFDVNLRLQKDDFLREIKESLYGYYVWAIVGLGTLGTNQALLVYEDTIH